ncbi:hypothetical protein RVF83_05960 [Gordonia rubripertincta]|uniref:Anti-sigma-M factor RsmA n=2 Tax=Gordonia rubripertincta TaxID=36822 RepID=A0AAW6REB9_GORRU|nr:hypothetical protein [Gordonia rubripertincta]MBM7276189.1 hypothetical protein [Gordonia rubripertincta]MDG6782785.1 hypothetical protein [Gordonia rubripertincta]NKY63994.1 hypothetical protein [Gordonia rubripertincta]QMU21756.1 hypothetical protein H3V45_04400 [Gordonia rubripertincta]GAB87535.1 hypothetical protein GORBP_103_00490 [Gordonia rubripertincta NBRC 101908]
MTPRGPDDTESGDLPDPPYSAETLADLHAGVLSERAATHIRAQITDDAAAQEILAALDRTTSQLRTSTPAAHTVPDHVRADVQATLAALAGAPATDAAAPPGPARPGPAQDAPVDLPARRERSGRSSRVLSVVLAAAAIAVVALGSIGVLRLMSSSPDDTPSPIQAQPGSTQILDPAGSASAISVLGRTDGAPFGSVAALRRCTAAHLVPATVVIVGSGRIIFHGGPAAAILLSTGVPGRFDALIVGLECDTDNPAFLARGTIGA